MAKCPACDSELVAVPDWNPELFRGKSNPITHYVCQNLECKGWYCSYCEKWQPFGTSCSVAMVRNVRSDTDYQTMDLRGYDLYRSSCQTTRNENE